MVFMYNKLLLIDSIGNISDSHLKMYFEEKTRLDQQRISGGIYGEKLKKAALIVLCACLILAGITAITVFSLRNNSLPEDGSGTSSIVPGAVVDPPIDNTTGIPDGDPKVAIYSALLSEKSVFDRNEQITFNFYYTYGVSADIIRITSESDHLSGANGLEKVFSMTEGDFSAEDWTVEFNQTLDFDHLKTPFPYNVIVDSESAEFEGIMLFKTWELYSEAFDPEDSEIARLMTFTLYYSANENNIAFSDISIEDAKKRLNDSDNNEAIKIRTERSL